MIIRIIFFLLFAAASASAATIEQFGGAGDGITDNTPALDAAAEALTGTPDMTLTFGRGQFVFKSAPKPITWGLHLVGQDMTLSVLIAEFEGDFLYFTGADGPGGGASNLALYAACGFAPYRAVRLEGGALHQPDDWRGDHLLITGCGTWYTGFEAIGNARIAPQPQGLRGVELRDVQVFRARDGSFWFSNVVGMHVFGGGAFVGAPNCNFYVGGGGTAETNSTLNDFIGVHNNCQLNITNSSFGTWLGGEIGSLATDSSFRWRIDTFVTGVVINNLASSVVSLK